jgi:hypothetical protein
MLVFVVSLCVALVSCGDDSEVAFSTGLSLKNAAGDIVNTVSRGENVTLCLSVTNLSSDPQSLRFTSSQAYEFLITNTPDLRPLWRWSHNKLFLAVMTDLQFEGGEVKVFEEIWDQLDNAGAPVSNGVYHAQGYMSTSEEKQVDGGPGSSPLRSPRVMLVIE